MSIRVDPADLATTLADFDSGYLVSTSSPTVKVVTIDPVVDDAGLLRIARPGRGTIANLLQNPVVTVVFSPRERFGYTLLVDGTASIEGEAQEDVVVTATSAVLHRPASHAEAADGPAAGSGATGEGCGHDCAPVTT